MIFDDITELNAAVKLDGLHRALVRFEVDHMVRMNLNEYDQAYLEALPDWYGMLEGMSKLGYAFTGVLDGRPMCCFGVMKMWPGVAEMWLVPDVDLSLVARSFHRAAKKFADICMSDLHLFRLQVTVNTLNVPADKWIKTLYFVEEGVLRQFGPDGSSHKMYSRLRETQDVAPDQGH
jgi:hypothetical protein|tara:strand:- start:8506 stop:9036 length:531 start_codon:yes stop_codon:yes gene_type:complete